MTSPCPDYYAHPVFIPDAVILDTPAITELRDNVNRWLWTGATGALITGRPRVGKSTAITMLSSQLRSRGGVRVPCFSASVPERDQHSIAAVWQLLCQSVDLPVAAHHRAMHLAERFSFFVKDQATVHKSRQAVLLVDDCHYLTPQQFSVFAEAYNRLRTADVALMTVFFGNEPEIWRTVEEIEQGDYGHVRGRFFTQGMCFRGLVSEAQVKHCLSQYDTLRFPAHGSSYTAYFLADAWAEGWRLATVSRPFWRAFRTYQQQLDIPSWGMQYFVQATNVLLTDFLPRYGVEACDDEMLDACIQASGLVPSLTRPAT